MTSTLTFKTYLSKVPYIRQQITPEGQMLVRFALWETVKSAEYTLSIYISREIEKDRKCTKWPQTDPEHLTVKSSLHTINSPGPNINENEKKNGKKNPTFEISQLFKQLW